MLNIKECPDHEIKKFTDMLKFNNEQLIIKGSYSIKNIYYYGDVDLFSPINDRYNIDEIYNVFLSILNDVCSNPFTYFIEFKIQQNNGNKTKYYDIQQFKTKFKKDFKNVEYCKIDLVVFVDYIFLEMSCIYQFHSKKSNYIDDIKSDVIEQADDGNYFKALKRMFLIAVANNDYNNVQKLINVFNSPLGKKYALLSNMKAIQLIMAMYPELDEVTKNRILINLKFKHLDVNNLNERTLEKNINNLSKNINIDSKKIYESLLYILNDK